MGQFRFRWENLEQVVEAEQGGRNVGGLVEQFLNDGTVEDEALLKAGNDLHLFHVRLVLDGVEMVLATVSTKE